MSLDDSKVLTTCELYSGPSLLVSQPELEALELEQEQLPPEQMQMESDDLELTEPLELGPDEHIAVSIGTVMLLTILTTMTARILML